VYSYCALGKILSSILRGKKSMHMLESDRYIWYPSLYLYKKRNSRARAVSKVIEYLPSKCKALISNISTKKKKKKREDIPKIKVKMP
jgi:hypothetical protein